MKVVILPEVEDYLEDLGRILYENEYFGFVDDAIEYVEDLVYEIKKNLHIRQHNPSPEHFKKFVSNLEQAECWNMQYSKRIGEHHGTYSSLLMKMKKPEMIYFSYATSLITTQ